MTEEKRLLTKEESDAVYAAIDNVADRNPKVDEVFRALNLAYNDGIDKAIEIVKDERLEASPDDSPPAVCQNIISKLKELKK